MKLLEIARQPVDDSKLLLDVNVHWPILHIDLSEVIHEFQPVICPLTEHVMHMDKAGFLWPCGGCTNSGNCMAFHEIYCPCNIMHDCNPKITLKENLSNKVCIPMEFQDAYEKFLYWELCKHSMSLFHATARNCGGKYFHLKSVLGDVMLLDEDCDEILCTSSHVRISDDSSLKKQTSTGASIEAMTTSSDDNKREEEIRIVVKGVAKWPCASFISKNIHSLEEKRDDIVNDDIKERESQCHWMKTKRLKQQRLL